MKYILDKKVDEIFGSLLILINSLIYILKNSKDRKIKNRARLLLSDLLKQYEDYRMYLDCRTFNFKIKKDDIDNFVSEINEQNLKIFSDDIKFYYNELIKSIEEELNIRNNEKSE